MRGTAVPLDTLGRSGSGRRAGRRERMRAEPAAPHAHDMAPSTTAAPSGSHRSPARSAGAATASIPRSTSRSPHRSGRTDYPAKAACQATSLSGVRIRPVELAGIKAGVLDLGFRRWDRPRVVVGTRMRTAVGLIEVTSVEPVDEATITEDDARRAGAASLDALRRGLAARRGPAGVPRGSALGRRGPADRVAAATTDGGRARRDPRSPGSPRRRVVHRTVDPADAGDHRPLARGPRAGPRRRARPRHAVVQARRPQAQGAGSDGVARHRLPALAPRRGGGRRRRAGARTTRATERYPAAEDRCAGHAGADRRRTHDARGGGRGPGAGARCHARRRSRSP